MPRVGSTIRIRDRKFKTRRNERTGVVEVSHKARGRSVVVNEQAVQGGTLPQRLAKELHHQTDPRGWKAERDRVQHNIDAQKKKYHDMAEDERQEVRRMVGLREHFAGWRPGQTTGRPPGRCAYDANGRFVFIPD